MSLANARRDEPGRRVLLTGNEAIARGALEAGVAFCASYPGSPAVEIAQTLFDLGGQYDIYGEWSTNEAVALEAAAAASFAGLRSICVMKQNGLNVASDFFMSVNMSGSKGGFVLVVGDDPAAHSSTNEIDSRNFARFAEVPLLEPATVAEAKEMTKYAFALSEQLGMLVMLRSPTRICHSRGSVALGEIDRRPKRARFDTAQSFATFVRFHEALHRRVAAAEEAFEQSEFNWYAGSPDAKTVIVTSGTGWPYSKEAVQMLGLGDRVGILKLGTTWPLPRRFVLQHLAGVDAVVFVEEVDPFLEQNVQVLAAQHLGRAITYYGKQSGHVAGSAGVGLGELNADLVIGALCRVLGVAHQPRPADYASGPLARVGGGLPTRDWALCAGCPHRASLWAIRAALEVDGRDGFILGDIGCYSLAFLRTGFNSTRTTHCMGAGVGLANGFGQLARFGFDQPVVALCGDSTFFHAALPALINARYNGAKLLLAVLDNGATGMTGFQPHPGTGQRASGAPAPQLVIEDVARSLGMPTAIADPYEVDQTIEQVVQMLHDGGPAVLVLRRTCALIAARSGPKARYRVDPARCLGDACGCARFCSRVFACPGCIWDEAAGHARIDEVVCNGCGVCATLCPRRAIVRAG